MYDPFDIDLNRLEEEAADQATVFIIYSKRLQKAKEKAAQRKAEMELIDSELDQRIRKKPKKFGLPDKVNEKMIAAAILRQPEHKKAAAQYRKASSKAGTFQIYVNALEHRRRMISDCVQLHGQQYFAKPFIHKKDRKVLKEIHEEEKRRARKKKR